VNDTSEEAKEKARRRAESEKARRKIQRRAKRPVFILGAFFSFTVWTLQVDLEAERAGFNVSLGAFVVLLVLYYKILTDGFNWVYRQLQDEGANGSGKPAKLAGFAAYAIAALLSTAVFAGLYLLVFLVLLGSSD